MLKKIKINIVDIVRLMFFAMLIVMILRSGLYVTRIIHEIEFGQKIYLEHVTPCSDFDKLDTNEERNIYRYRTILEKCA